MQDNKRIIGIKLPNEMTDKGISMLMDALEEFCSDASVLDPKEVEEPNINPFDEKVMRIG